MVTLSWTATGNDDRNGHAARYELRYSTTPVGADVAAWWGAASPVTNLPHPSAAGQQDHARVTHLTPETTYYFILRAFDEAGNGSDFSNVAVATTNEGVLMAGSGSLHAFPNPSHDAFQFVVHVEGTAPQSVHVRVFDMAGRVVGDVADGVFPPGDTRITWSGRTVWGSRVAPGYYETVGTIGQTTARERIVLLP